MREDVEVLLRGVQHGDGVTGEQAPQWSKVDSQRVDQSGLAVDGELDERQLREVGPLAMELGVEGIARFLGQTVDECLEIGLRVDPAMAHAGWSPMTVSRPLFTQASVPPATLTASTPCCRRNSHTR